MSILPFVILQVFARANAGNPIGMIAIPVYRFPQAAFKRNGWTPAELGFDLAAVDGIAAVVSGPIGDKANQGPRLAHGLQEGVGNLEVGPLAAPADIVYLSEA